MFIMKGIPNFCFDFQTQSVHSSIQDENLLNGTFLRKMSDCQGSQTHPNENGNFSVGYSIAFKISYLCTFYSSMFFLWSVLDHVTKSGSKKHCLQRFKRINESFWIEIYQTESSKSTSFNPSLILKVEITKYYHLNP